MKNLNFFQNMQIADGASFCLENHEDQLSSFKGSPDDENDCEVSSECDDASCEGGGASEGSSKLAGSVSFTFAAVMSIFHLYFCFTLGLRIGWLLFSVHLLVRFGT